MERLCSGVAAIYHAPKINPSGHEIRVAVGLDIASYPIKLLPLSSTTVIRSPPVVPLTLARYQISNINTYVEYTGMPPYRGVIGKTGITEAVSRIYILTYLGPKRNS